MPRRWAWAGTAAVPPRHPILPRHPAPPPRVPLPASGAPRATTQTPHFRRRLPLPASPSSSGGGSYLPTSVEERMPSTARPHLPSASRSRTVHLLFHRLVSFSTSAHRIFCCVFHSGHTLKRWSLVCEGHLHRQHWESGRTLAHAGTVRCHDRMVVWLPKQAPATAVASFLCLIIARM